MHEKYKYINDSSKNINKIIINIIMREKILITYQKTWINRKWMKKKLVKQKGKITLFRNLTISNRQ